MSTRQEIQDRRGAMKRTLRERCRAGELRAGTLAPSKRQMAQEFGVSTTVVAQVMQELMGERLFHTVARSGTYVGAARPLVRPRYLFLSDDESKESTVTRSALPVRAGFEDRIAHLGGAALALLPAQFAALEATRTFPNVAGVMEWNRSLSNAQWMEMRGSVPACASYSTLEGEAHGRDSVAFDDCDGGRQATEHLIHLGFGNIAFLGLHRQGAFDEGGPAWSGLREDGWRAALQNEGLRADLAFHAARPTGSNSHPEQVETARAAAHEILRRNDVDAVVTANDRAAQALLEALRASHRAPYRWPAIVSFDNDPHLQSESLTSLRLPWEEIGRAAADLLWERVQGHLPAEPQHRLVKMRLIPRLTCQPGWTQALSDALFIERLVPAAQAV